MGKNLWRIRSSESLADGSTILMSEEAHCWCMERKHEHYAEEIIAQRPLVLNGMDISIDLEYVFEVFKKIVPREDYPLYLNVDLKVNYFLSSFSKPVDIDISNRWRQLVAKELL